MWKYTVSVSSVHPWFEPWKGHFADTEQEINGDTTKIKLLTSPPSQVQLHGTRRSSTFFCFHSLYLVWELDQGLACSAHCLSRVRSGELASCVALRCEVTSCFGSMKAPFHRRPRETSKHLMPGRKKKKRVHLSQPHTSSHWRADGWSLYICGFPPAPSGGLAAKTQCLSALVQLNLFSL